MRRHVPPKYNWDENPKVDGAETEVNVSDSVFVCSICGKNFHRKASLTVHVNSHSVINNNLEDEKDERGTQNTCKVCCKKFTAKKNLLKHLRDVHKNFKEAESMVVKKIKCPEKDCKFMCRMMKELREHIEKSHKIKIFKDTLQFSSETVFQKWKKEEESNTVSWFVTGRKKTTLMDGTKKQTLYCHRTGHYNPKGFGKYRMRSVGSCKIGVTCPAAMEVTESPDGQLTVIYYKTHLGHLQDVVYLKLSREERAHLAEKIEQGFSFDAILEDVKESRGCNEEKKKRIHLLSKKDLYSIMRTVNGVKKIRNEGDEGVKVRELEGGSRNELLGNLGKVDENLQQSFALYPAHSVIIPEDTPPIETYQKQEREPDIPQPPGEEVTSQIVILSPDIDYASVAEIILLSAGETGPQPAFLTQNKVENLPSEKADAEGTPPAEITVEERSRIKKSNLRLQLQEKLERISEFLPKAEFLTPKQFDLINTKLDGIMEIFNVASAKAQNRKRRVVKSIRNPEGWEKGVENKEQEQVYDSPLVYAVYN